MDFFTYQHCCDQVMLHAIWALKKNIYNRFAMLVKVNVMCLFCYYKIDNCAVSSAAHVDGFLYNDEDVDELCDSGKMSRNYCVDCGSHQVAPLSKCLLLVCYFLYHYQSFLLVGTN